MAMDNDGCCWPSNPRRFWLLAWVSDNLGLHWMPMIVIDHQQHGGVLRRRGGVAKRKPAPEQRIIAAQPAASAQKKRPQALERRSLGEIT